MGMDTYALRSKATTRQEIQTIKDQIHSDAANVLQDSVGQMQSLTQEVKSLKVKIENAVNKVNESSETNLLAIKAVEDLIGIQEQKLDKEESNRPLIIANKD